MHVPFPCRRLVVPAERCTDVQVDADTTLQLKLFTWPHLKDGGVAVVAGERLFEEVAERSRKWTAEEIHDKDENFSK